MDGGGGGGGGGGGLRRKGVTCPYPSSSLIVGVVPDLMLVANLVLALKPDNIPPLAEVICRLMGYTGERYAERASPNSGASPESVQRDMFYAIRVCARFFVFLFLHAMISTPDLSVDSLSAMSDSGSVVFVLARYALLITHSSPGDAEPRTMSEIMARPRDEIIRIAFQRIDRFVEQFPDCVRLDNLSTTPESELDPVKMTRLRWDPDGLMNFLSFSEVFLHRRHARGRKRYPKSSMLFYIFESKALQCFPKTIVQMLRVKRGHRVTNIAPIRKGSQSCYHPSVRHLLRVALNCVRTGERVRNPMGCAMGLTIEGSVQRSAMVRLRRKMRLAERENEFSESRERECGESSTVVVRAFFEEGGSGGGGGGGDVDDSMRSPNSVLDVCRVETDPSDAPVVKRPRLTDSSNSPTGVNRTRAEIIRSVFFDD